MSVFDRLTDKTTYTGVYARRFEEGGAINSSTQLSVTAAESFVGSTNTGTDMPIHDISQTFRPGLRKHATPEREQAEQLDPIQLGAADLSQLTTDDVLQRIFAYYAAFGHAGGGTGTMDNANFSKLTREAPGMLNKRLTPTDVDLAFVRCHPKGQRKVNYAQFIVALVELARKRYPTLDEAGSFGRFLAHHVFKVPCSPMRASGTGTSGATGPVVAAAPAPRASSPPAGASLAGAAPSPQQQQRQREVPADPAEAYRQQRIAGVTYAGEGIKAGSVYERLTDKKSYTGVYKKLAAGERINAHGDAGRSGVTSGYSGDTNTGTDEIIHDIGVLMRPNLQSTGSRGMRF